MKRIRHIIGKVLAIPAIVVALPLIVVGGLIALPFIFVFEIRAAIALRVFRRKEAGHVFLVCTSKRSWHDFLKNNVIPTLPESFRVVWVKSVRDARYPDLLGHFSRSRIFGISKPYMVFVTRKKLYCRSFNAVLQELKASPKKSKDTQAACLIINKELGELRTNC
jgi:hypothetical protein